MLDFIPFAPGRSLARSPACGLARSARWLSALTLTGLAATVALPALAAPAPVGPPITVYDQFANLTLPAEQASVDARANGDFAVAWIDDAGSVRVQRYGANGVAQTAALVAGVGSLGVFRNGQLDVAMGEDGSVVVVWQHKNPSSGKSAVFYRRMLPDGLFAGLLPNRVDTSLLPTGLIRPDSEPAVAAGVDGRFVVSWHRQTNSGESEVRARAFTALGAGGDEFAPHQIPGEHEVFTDVAMDASGGYAVVWTFFPIGSEGSQSAIRMQRFNASGRINGAEQTVINADATSIVINPAITLNAAGDVTTVAWRTGLFPRGSTVRARRYGGPAPAVFDVSEPGIQGADYVRVNSDAAGRVAVMWGERETALPVVPKAQVRRFDTFGAPLDVTPLPIGVPIEADDIAMDADGDLVVAGSSRTKPNSFLASPPIFQTVRAQRLQGLEPVDLTVTHQIQTVPSPPLAFELIYKVRVSNLHPPVALGVAPVVQSAIGAASEVVVVTGTGFGSASGTGWTCRVELGRQRCNYRPNLGPGETAADLIMRQLGATGSPPSISSTVSANQLDPNLSNNTVQTPVPGPQ